jgi:hypothetical protein
MAGGAQLPPPASEWQGRQASIKTYVRPKSPDWPSGLLIFLCLIFLLTPAPSRRRLCPSHLRKKRACSFRECPMHRPPPLRGDPVLAGKKVLLIDRCQATREVRAAVLRSRGVEVHEAEEFSTTRFLWHTQCLRSRHARFPQILRGRDARVLRADQGRKSGAALRLSDGAPTYLSLKWPGEIAVNGVLRGQWAETARRVMAAA